MKCAGRLFSALAFTVTLAAASAPPAFAQETASAGYSVRLEGAELFRVRRPLGPFTAQERAQRIEERLQAAADDPFFSTELVQVEVSEREGRLNYRGETIGIVTVEDAAAEGQPLEQVVAERLERTQAAVARYREQRLPAERSRTGLYLALATASLALLLSGVTRLHRRFAASDALSKPHEPPRSVNVLSQPMAALVQTVRRRGLAWARIAAFCALVLVYLEVVFALVPLTRGFAQAILGYVVSPLLTLWGGFLARIGDLFFIAVVGSLTFYVLRFLRWLSVHAQRGSIQIPGVDADHALRLYKLSRIALVALAAVMVFPYIPGSGSAAFRGLSLFFGAVLTLGSSGSVGNFVGGVLLLFNRLFKVGDRIRVGEVEGDVVELDLMVTRLRTPKNEVVSVPNGIFLSTHATNFSARAATDGLILHTAVTIGYDAPWRQVHQLLRDAAAKTEGLMTASPAFVLQRALGDFYVEYELNVSTRDAAAKEAIYSRLHQNIQDEFNRAGVQIMSPHYVADPAQPKLAALDTEPVAKR